MFFALFRLYIILFSDRVLLSFLCDPLFHHFCGRSDVLGQFMPLVGMDWSQTGVAHLFSAIKVWHPFQYIDRHIGKCKICYI